MVDPAITRNSSSSTNNNTTCQLFCQSCLKLAQMVVKSTMPACANIDQILSNPYLHCPSVHPGIFSWITSKVDNILAIVLKWLHQHPHSPVFPLSTSALFQSFWATADLSHFCGLLFIHSLSRIASHAPYIVHPSLNCHCLGQAMIPIFSI